MLARGMRVQIVTPEIRGVRTGNFSSAEQWRSVLEELGHDVTISPHLDGEPPDWLIGLHAIKSAGVLMDCRRRFPDTKLALVMTGTDIYPEPGPEALASMRLADRLVGLQPKVAEQLPEELRSKLRVIVQASAPGEMVGLKTLDPFDVCVVGHMRAVKDPMLCAQAARLLPTGSKIRIRHAGAILDPAYAAVVVREQRENPRYEWLGQLDASAVRDLISNSQLLVLTSISEGAGRVVGSAIVKGTPVLSTRIHGVMGLVGDDYPGLFPVGDAEALARLLSRSEREPQFRDELASACAARASLFDPQCELAGWRNLIEEPVTRC